MNKLITTLILLGTSLGLVACGGGGGDSSSGGGGSVDPQYIGTYTGSALMTVSGFGGTASDSFPITITIANDGRISIVVNGLVAEAQCSAGEPAYLSGNTYSASYSGTCTDPTLGTCTVNGTESGSVNNSAISGSGSGTYNCTVGSFTANFTYTATKVQTAAQSFSAQSVTTTQDIESGFYSNVAGFISKNR